MAGWAGVDAYRRGKPDEEAEKASGRRLKMPRIKRGNKKLSPDFAIYALLSMVLGRAVVLNELMPFGIAFLAGVFSIMPEKSWFVLIFVIVGTATVAKGIGLWGTILVTVSLFLLLQKVYFNFRQKWFGIPLLAFAVDIIAKSSILAVYNKEMYSYIAVIFEGLLVAIFTYIFVNGIIGIKKKNISAIRKEELLCYLLILIGVISGISGLQFHDITLRGILSRFVILIATYAGGSGAATAIGTFVGIVPNISSIASPSIVGLYAISGLLAGAFRSFGRLGITLGFVLGNIIMSIYFVDNAHLLVMLIETAVAVGFFILIPHKFLVNIKNWFRSIFGNFGNSDASEHRLREVTSVKINEFARIFEELSRTFEQITCDLQAREENDLQMLFNSISSKVCKGCSVYRVCWEKEFYKTYKSIIDLFSLVEERGLISEKDISECISKRCSRLKELAIIINCLHDTQKLNQYWNRKLSESREIVANQLSGVSAIMHNLASEITTDADLQEDIEIILRRELFRQGIQINSLSVMAIREGNFEVKITKPSCGGKYECVHSISPLVSKVIGQQFTLCNSNYCTKKTGAPVCEFKLYPAMTYQVEWGAAKVAKSGSLISGDNYSTINMRDGKFALILSDGMGVGNRAAMESNATISLLEKLLETGFDKDLSIKIVNSILVLRSPEETFATVDLAIVDLFSGICDFMKIGSAPSFLKRGSKVSIIKSNCLPIGILNTIEVESIQKQLETGDIIIMVSDGILDSDKDNAKSEEDFARTLKSILAYETQDIADLILEQAIARAGGEINDDMAVLVAKINKK